MRKARRLRVLHVNLSLEPGGMENGIVNVANRLPEDEFELFFCCLETGGAFVERLNHPENVFAFSKAPGFSLSTVWNVMKTVARTSPDVVHPHNLAPLTYATLGTFLGFWKPLLQGEHGVFQGEQGSARRLLQRRRLYHCCRKVHTVSEGLRQYLIAQGFPGNKIVSVVNGVDTARFVPADRVAIRRQINLPPEATVLGIVGRFDPNKKHLLLLEAFHRIAEGHPSVHFLILGDNGSERENILAAVEASPCRSRIHLAGFQADPLPWYQAMDLLVMPSPFEGLSNAVLEAMACAVPVLGNVACGNAEVIEHGVDGVLAGLDSVDTLAVEIARLLDAPKKVRQLAEAARRKMVERFSINAMVDRYAALYREVAGWG